MSATFLDRPPHKGYPQANRRYGFHPSTQPRGPKLRKGKVVDWNLNIVKPNKP